MSQTLRGIFEEKTPDFLEALERLAKEGFFTDFDVQVFSAIDTSNESVRLVFTGYLPRGDRKRFPRRISPILTVEEIRGSFETARRIFEEGKYRITHLHCETKYEDWPF